MISIRESVFETNSSSCHSLSMNCKRKDIEDFNAGKLYYVELPGDIHNYFHKAEDIVEKLRDVDPVVVDFSGGRYTHGIDIWNYDKEDIEDQKNFANWLIENVTADMLDWAFSDDPTPKYFSKKIIKNALQEIATSAWYTPLWKIEDFFDNGLSISISRDFGSDVDLDARAKKFTVREGADNSNVSIKFDFYN